MAQRRTQGTSPPKRFRAKIRTIGVNRYVDVPESLSKAFAAFATAGRITFDGTLKGTPVRGTLVPAKAGSHRLYVNGGMRSAAGVDVGDTVTFVLRATAPGVVRPPADLTAALRRAKGAKTQWEALPASQRRELLRYVDAALTKAARAKRIGKVVESAADKPVKRDRPKPAAVVTRPLWTCPRCGNQFVNKNQWHSCHRGDVDATFRGKPAFVRELFDRFREIVESCGPVKMLPYRDKVGFMVRVRFAGAIPRQRWLEVGFWLPRRIDDTRMYRVETLYPDVHVHRLRVTKMDELDGQLTKWLREAYAVGCQEQLAVEVD